MAESRKQGRRKRAWGVTKPNGEGLLFVEPPLVGAPINGAGTGVRARRRGRVVGPENLSSWNARSLTKPTTVLSELRLRERPLGLLHDGGGCRPVTPEETSLHIDLHVCDSIADPFQLDLQTTIRGRSGDQIPQLGPINTVNREVHLGHRLNGCCPNAFQWHGKGFLDPAARDVADPLVSDQARACSQERNSNCSATGERK